MDQRLIGALAIVLWLGVRGDAQEPWSANGSDQATQGSPSQLISSSFGITKAQLESTQELQTVIRAHEGIIRGSKVDLLLKSGAPFVLVTKVATELQGRGVRNLTYWDKQADNSSYEIIVRCSPRDGRR